MWWFAYYSESLKDISTLAVLTLHNMITTFLEFRSVQAK